MRIQDFNQFIFDEFNKRKTYGEKAELIRELEDDIKNLRMDLSILDNKLFRLNIGEN